MSERTPITNPTKNERDTLEGLVKLPTEYHNNINGLRTNGDIVLRPTHAENRIMKNLIHKLRYNESGSLPPIKKNGKKKNGVKFTVTKPPKKKGKRSR